MAAQIMVAYPDLRPETVRALLVHSARWTDAMKRANMGSKTNPSKADYQSLLKQCGFGLPDLDRALWSVSNSLSMVIQEEIRPFRKATGAPVTSDMHLHHLPWPRTALEELGAAVVEMRVTLSYFVEPNPSRRGIQSRYRYESHGLRFAVKRPLESVELFRKRINQAARNDGEKGPKAQADPSWLVGAQGRHRGSLHSDIWRGTAAELASRGVIAVYPTTGWWKTRYALQRYDRDAPYALVVSISTPTTSVDLLAEVENRITAAVAIER